ncbi:MAG: cytochrome c biogenesis protein CcdA [Bacteroidaceae bacterium]|nr:cytochrome c biogenesis protein CcdA [Bacteroidaceae bacterium]
MKKFFLHISMLMILALVPVCLLAQMNSPVRFDVKTERVASDELQVIFSAHMEPGWHVYSSRMEEGGPTVASFHLEECRGVKVIGPLESKGKLKEKYDDLFEMRVSYMEGSAVFVQRVRIENKDYSATGYLEYGACNETNCLPPTQVPFALEGSDGPVAEKAKIQKKAIMDARRDSAMALEKDTATMDAKETTADLPAWWLPVTGQLDTFSQEKGGLWWIFLMGLLGGLLATITPCVWPVIPMTISYFLKRSANRSHGIRDALLYGLCIVMVYVSLGLVITLVAGSSGLNALSTSAVFNIICFLILLLFSASFLGGFEISLPSAWGNTTDRKAENSSGFTAIFLMALTLTIVSFSCTGPIIGFLLVDISSSSDYLSPLAGMTGFALALALPFTLFALFPSLIKKSPKSGGWMNKVKVTLGFVELAFALKFLSVADMSYGWHILDRETFLVLWIVLFAMLGFYLLGKLRFPSDDPSSHTSILGFFCGWISLAFALYMVPGLWGAPLKSISAFAPPMSTQDFRLDREREVHARFNDYDEAVEYARQTGKPLLLDFTGYGCVNCRKMEASVWTDPSVAQALEKDFILVSLYVDDRTTLPAPRKVVVNGKEQVFTEYRQLWSFLQSYKFGANTQPFYVAVNAEGKPLNKSYAYDENPAKFLEYLQESLNNMKSIKKQINQ